MGRSESKRVSVLQAARELGVSPQAVRIQMQRGILDIGEVMECVNGESGRFRYWIFRDKLDRVLGKQ